MDSAVGRPVAGGRRTRVVLAWLVAVSGVIWLAACTQAGTTGTTGTTGKSVADRPPAQPVNPGCLTIARGAMYGPGLLLPTWLPADFRQAPSTQAGSAIPTENFTLATGRSDPPGVALGVSRYEGRLGASGTQVSGAQVKIQGHDGLLEIGSRARISAYWTPDGAHLLSVTGFRLSASTVVAVARNVWFDPPGLVPLPVGPGRIVSKAAAASSARRASHLTAARAVTKLSSWAEVAALLQVAHLTRVLAGVPGALDAARWQPVWAALVTAGRSVLVILNAATGQPVVTAPVRERPAWFAGLTDRSKISPRRCQGGSRSLVPFGVLTRDEEAYVVATDQVATSHSSTSVTLKLTTVPAVNRADPGIFGGCVQQSCSIRELVWMIITTVRASPGTTVPCLPASASSPQHYRPSQVSEYVWITVPGNDSTYCDRLPAPIAGLRDLAPPVRLQTCA